MGRFPWSTLVLPDFPDRQESFNNFQIRKNTAKYGAWDTATYIFGGLLHIFRFFCILFLYLHPAKMAMKKPRNYRIFTRKFIDFDGLGWCCLVHKESRSRDRSSHSHELLIVHSQWLDWPNFGALLPFGALARNESGYISQNQAIDKR